jgi:hypothetical protein
VQPSDFPRREPTVEQQCHNRNTVTVSPLLQPTIL